jgi:hypothetical protein
MKMSLADELKTIPYRKSAGEGHVDDLRYLFSKEYIRFAGTDADMAREFQRLENKATYAHLGANGWGRMAHLAKTLSMIEKDGIQVEGMMRASGYMKRSIEVIRYWWERKIPVWSAAVPRIDSIGSLDFYEREEGNMLSIISDRDWETGEWVITPYFILACDSEEFYREISDGAHSFYANHFPAARKEMADAVKRCLGSPVRVDMDIECLMKPPKDTDHLLEIIRLANKRNKRHLWAV